MPTGRNSFFNTNKPKDKFYIFNTTINHFHTPKEKSVQLQRKKSCASKISKFTNQTNKSVSLYPSPSNSFNRFTHSFLTQTTKPITSDKKQAVFKTEKSKLPLKTEPYDSTLKKKADQLIVKNNILVTARFRPYSNIENELNDSNANEEPIQIDENSVIIKNEQTTYSFDKVFKSTDTQSYIYECIGKQTVKDILDGYNGTIFTYGNTNSGKTYTMFGDDIESPEMMGIIPRIGLQIFDFIEESNDNVEFEIRCSILEIYKENLRDLLNKENSSLRIKESPSRGIFVEGLLEPCVSNQEEMLSIISIGQKIREVGSTRLNEQSSRSHAIFIMQITQKLGDGSEKRGILNLIDLAGSENVSKSGAEGKSLEEAKKINLSLSALCNVIHALTTKSDHIPYRDSKLTRILQESLGGNFKTSLIITCSSHASHLPETISSLKFGKRAKAVKNSAKINISQKSENYELIIQSVKAELDAAKKEIKRLRNGSDESVVVSYPAEIVLSPTLGVQNDHMRVIVEKYKSEIESLKSENMDLQNRLNEYMCEVKKLKKEKFNSDKKCIEYEQLINSYKLKESHSEFEIKKSNIELDIYKKEISSLSEAFNEIEVEMYKALKEKKIHLLKSSDIVKGNMTAYLGKQIIDDGVNKKSFISSVDIQEQFEADRQILKNIIEVSLDENTLLKNSKHSSELYNSIEEASIPKDVVLHLYKNNMIDLIIYNHCLQRMLVSIQWRKIIEFSKAKVKHELYNLMDAQLKQVECMLENAHQSQNKLLKHIDKYNSNYNNCSPVWRKLNTTNINLGKAKVKKTTSKAALQCFHSYVSTKNVLGFLPTLTHASKNPASMNEAIAIIKEQQEIINKIKSTYNAHIPKLSEDRNETEFANKNIITEENESKSNYLEVELNYQTQRSKELKQAWLNSQKQIDKLKDLISTLQEKSESSLKEEFAKWNEIIASLKSNYEAELLRKQNIITKLHKTLGEWVNRYNECTKSSINVSHEC